MGDFGIFSDVLPLFLGQEKLLILNRIISRSEITAPANLSNGRAADYFKEVYLGPPEQVFAVFAEYQAEPALFNVWTAGSWSESVWGSGITDNVLVLRESGWFLIVYQPPGLQNEPLLKTDFYVFRMTTHAEPTTDKYGLNIYDIAGNLQYHSGWHVLRAKKSVPLPSLNAPEGNSQRGTSVIVFSLNENDYIMSPSRQPVVDWQGLYGLKTDVGANKLVNIGYAYSVRGYGNGSLAYTAYFAPFIFADKLGYSLAHAGFGGHLASAVDNDGRARGWIHSAISMPLIIDKPIL